MADKDFKVKNKLFINGLSNASGVLLAQNNAVDATTAVATQYGGTGTTTSPNAGQVLYSSAGSTYAPTTLADLVTGAKYQADAPSSPAVGQIWIESDSSSDSFDPNIIRRQSFTATAGQTVFTTSYTWIQGYEQVYLNGLLLLRTTDYTTSNDDTVTLVEAAALNDILEVVTVTNLNVNVGGYTQDSAPSTPVDGEIWLDTDGTLAETAYIANSIVDAKGDLITATADNTPIKLARGTDGQYLQTDSTTATGLKWADISVGGMTLIQSISASGNSTVEFTSIPSTYKNLQVIIRNFRPTDDAASLNIRFNSDSGAARHGGLNFSAITSSAQTFATTEDVMTSSTDNTVANGLIWIDIYDYANTTTWKIARETSLLNDATTTTSYVHRSRHSFYNQTAAISSLLFFATTGTIASGTFLLYGVK